MIAGFIALLACQLVGQFIAAALNVQFPGPVIGMVIFLVVLLIRRPDAKAGVVRAADGLLRHLQLLFIPAGVGFIAYLRLIGAQWLPILAGMLISFLVALLVTAAASTGMLKLESRFNRTTTAPDSPE